MRSDIIELLNKDNDYWIFLRERPYWHQRLSYFPEQINNFIEEYNREYSSEYSEWSYNTYFLCNFNNHINAGTIDYIVDEIYPKDVI